MSELDLNTGDPEEVQFINYVREQTGINVLSEVKENWYRGYNNTAYASEAALASAFNGITEPQNWAFSSYLGEFAIVRLIPAETDPGTSDPTVLVLRSGADVGADYGGRVIDIASGRRYDFIRDGSVFAAQTDYRASGMSWFGSDYNHHIVSTANKPFEGSDAWPSITVGTPISDIDMDVEDNNWSWINYVDAVNPENSQRVMWTTNASGGNHVRFLFTRPMIPGMRINLTVTFRHIANTDDSYTVRVGGEPTDPEIGRIDLTAADPFPVNRELVAVYDVTAQDTLNGYVVFFLRRDAAAAAANPSAIIRYSLDIETVFPDPDARYVARFASINRGIELPKILPGDTYRDTGAVATHAANGRLIHARGTSENYIVSVRPVSTPVSVNAIYLASRGNPNMQGWTGSFSNWGYPEDIDGFTGLWRVPNNTQETGMGTWELSPVSATDWAAAYTNGFHFNYRCYWVGGDLHQINVEPVNTGGWGAGRFTANIRHITSGVDYNLNVDSVDYGPYPANELIDLDIICTDPSAGVADLYRNGVLVTQVNYTGYNGQRDLYFWDNDAANRDVLIQSCSLYIIDPAFTLTADQIDNNARIVIPASPKPYVITMPKGIFPIGTTFSVCRNSQVTATITGAASDVHTFNGQTSYTIAGDCTFTQTQFPEGANWSVEGG